MSGNNSDSKIVVGCISLLVAVAAILIIYLPLIVYFTWAGAVVLTNLWQWFIVPVFGLPPLTLLQAAGMALAIGYLTKPQLVSGKAEDDHVKLWTMVIMAMLSPWITLLAGYIIHSFQ